jgi:hypothetical protein
MIEATKAYYATLSADRPRLPAWDELNEKQQAKVAKLAYNIFNDECMLASSLIVKSQ